jgi:hypothetical protein
MAAVPVHYHDQINEAMGQSNVRNVHPRRLAMSSNFKLFYKIRIDLMIRSAHGQPRIRIYCYQPQ